MNRIVDWIRSWPRWLRYGFLSVIGAGILLSPLLITGNQNIISLGSFAPMLLLSLLPGVLSESIILSIPIILGYWFLVGALLGKFTKKFVWAAIIWLLVHIIGGIVIAVIALIAVFSSPF